MPSTKRRATPSKTGKTAQTTKTDNEHELPEPEFQLRACAWGDGRDIAEEFCNLRRHVLEKFSPRKPPIGYSAGTDTVYAQMVAHRIRRYPEGVRDVVTFELLLGLFNTILQHDCEGFPTMVGMTRIAEFDGKRVLVN